MAGTMSILGRLTGRILRHQAVDRTVTAASKFLLSELRLADLRLKQAYLRRKHSDHLHLLGRTAYRMHLNGIVLQNEDKNIEFITSVLRQIDCEVEAVEKELESRKKQAGMEREMSEAASD